MSTAEALSAKRPAIRSEEFDYRPMNTGAIASLVFGLLSTMIFFAGRDGFQNSLLLTPLPLIGIALGIRAMATMRANPDQFTGGAMAKVGTALSVLSLVGGLAFSGYVYATEVPEGYARTSFFDLQPDDIDLRGGHAVPPDIAALDGKKVFIKGYIRPDSTNSGYTDNISSFLLVRDSNSCCFGDLSTVKYFDQVAVMMAPKADRVKFYNGYLYRMAGTLKILPENAHDGASGPAFALIADLAE
jgi:hypothetical protein